MPLIRCISRDLRFGRGGVTIAPKHHQGGLMKANPMRVGVERGEVQIGTWINLIRNPAILPLLKAAGLDFARIDMEHSSPSIETVADMALVARALDFPIAVRPPKANREWITRLLDIGVMNLHCPQVESAAHAAEIVAATRYAPDGLRGMAGFTPGNDYETTGTVAERLAFANRQVFVTVMLETARAFDDLDEIAAMDGIDALTLGPTDLAQDLGVFGTPGQARVLDERRELILAAARKHGKTCAMLVSSAAQARRWKDAGVLLLAYASDAEVLHGAFSRAIAEIKG
jgi:2-keto-3-deoxy-L-rhamnonate aldolase RhmA